MRMKSFKSTQILRVGPLAAPSLMLTDPPGHCPVQNKSTAVTFKVGLPFTNQKFSLTQFFLELLLEK